MRGKASKAQDPGSSPKDDALLSGSLPIESAAACRALMKRMLLVSAEGSPEGGALQRGLGRSQGRLGLGHLGLGRGDRLRCASGLQ